MRFNVSTIIYEKYCISHAKFLHLMHYMDINNSKTKQNEYEKKCFSMDEFTAFDLDRPEQLQRR